ncbi:BRCT domain-containing DNA repair protein [Euphorbia peplus]|nr:BRCT domain-containing DNA repair protein [Euphorbia peplus]
MADLIDFQSRSALDFRCKDATQTHYPLFQDTIPLDDDTVALDTPPNDTHFDLDMRIDPITELDNEIVLDSEDEPDCGDNGTYRTIQGKKVGFFKRLPCSPSRSLKGFGDASERSHANQQCGTDTTETPPKIGSDQVSAGFDIDADEPEESSQENALNFVNTYLSLNKVVFSPKTEPRDVVRQNVFPASGFKGCQNLAKQINNRHPNGRKETFKWVDNDHCGEVGFFGKRIGATFGDSTNVACFQEQISLVNFDKDAIQLGQESDACNIETDAVDVFDIGISTQMAAEAMKALSYGLNSDNNVGQSPQDLLVDSPTEKRTSCYGKSRTHKGSISNLKPTARRSRERKSSYRKGTSSSYLKHPSYQDLDSESEKTSERESSRIMAGRSEGRDTTSQNRCSNGQTLKPVDKRDKSEDKNKNNIEKCEEHQVSLQKKYFDHQTGKWMTEQKLEGAIDKTPNLGGKKNDITRSSIVTYKRKRSRLVNNSCAGLSAGQCVQGDISSHQAGHLMAGGELERPKDGANNLHERMNHTANGCIITYQRKKRPLGDKLSAVLSTEGKNTTLCCNTSKVKRNNKLTDQTQDSSEVYSLTSCSYNFNTWNCAKRKRTLRKCPRLSNGAKNQYTPLIFDAKENYRRQYNKNLPKSSILKELIRLGITDQKPSFEWKGSRKRRDIANVKVLFSQHLDDDIIKQQKRIMVRFHISVALCSMDATHFVADKFVRTRNMLETIALGKPVVTHLWLESCAEASCLIDEKNYILRDAKKEKEIGFCMPVTLARAIQHPLLEGRRVLITPNVKPDKETISSLVKAVHGQAIEEVQISALKIPDDLLILSCEEDEDICVPFLDEGAAVYSSELLLNGVVIQKLEYKRHQLFTKYGQRNRRASKRRRSKVETV